MSPAAARFRPALLQAAPVLLFILLLGLCWVGFLGSDDTTYATGAYGWIEHFPYVGGHGTIRYPITLPTALSFLALGGNEFALVLPTLLYALGLIGVCWFALSRLVDPVSAALALAALCTLPVLVVFSTIASVDIVEAFFLFTGIMITLLCMHARLGPRWLVAAGASLGLAFLTRETAIFIAVPFAVFLLLGLYMERRLYLLIVLGFLGIWLLEVAYLWAMTGDPLYRVTISLHHDSTIDRHVDLAGNVLVHPLVDPLLVLFINQEFALLFYLAVPAAVWLCFAQGVEERTRRVSRILSIVALAWFACSAAAVSLLPLNPRYFLICALAACLLLGLWGGEMIRRRRTALVFVVLAILLSGNLASLSLENTDVRRGERFLADLTERYPDQVIHTDPMTRHRADLLLKWRGAQALASDVAPVSGGLMVYNPNNASTPNRLMDTQAMALYQPRSGWRPILTVAPRQPFGVRLMQASGLYRLVPEALWRRIVDRNKPITLYRLP